MDRVGADFDAVVKEVHEKLGATALPILIPLGSEDSLRGQIDVVNQKAVIFTEDDTFGSTYTVRDLEGDEVELGKVAYAELLEAVAGVDEALGEKFLLEEEITREELKAGLRKATIANEIVPVAGGSAFKNKGVQYLLDAVIDYLPSPLDVAAIVGHPPGNEEEDVPVEVGDEGKFCALAFKLLNDKHFGRFVFFRVYSGTVSKGDQIFNPRTGKKERVGRLIQIQADRYEDLETCYSGDIAGMVGLKETVTGDTLSDPKFKIALEPPIFPEPVIGLAVEPRSTADSDKMSLALAKLADEDPTFVVSTNEETGQTIISGMGELHLEVIIDRLLLESKVQARVGKPQISYRESIAKGAKGEGKFVRQTGGNGQYGHVILEASPKERGSGNTYEDKTTGGSIPKEFMNSVFGGLREAMTTGPVAGYPVVDVHVEVKDGSFHEVDSNENSFRMAAIFAIRDAFSKANAILLEPVMDVEVSTPPDYQGDVMSDLNRRRAHLGSMETKGAACTLQAQIPLSEMFGYMTDLRTLSSGRASFTMEPRSFEPVPDRLVDILTGRRPAA
jgi:elongation factor G